MKLLNKKKLLAAVTAAVMATAMVPAVSFATEVPDNLEGEASEGYVDNQLLVIYNSEADVEKNLDEAAETAGTSVESSEVIAEDIIPDGDLVQVEVSEDNDVDAMIEELEKDPLVETVQRNFVYDLMEEDVTPMATTNDPKAGDQYYLGSWDSTFAGDCGTSVTDAWDQVKTEGAVTVAVLDSGVYSDHPDLKANLDMEHAIDVTNPRAEPGTVPCEIGHGTHVAGIVAACADNNDGIAGVSYNAKVLPICIVDEYGTLNSGYLLAAYSYLESLIKSGELTNLHVINMSLGGYTIDSGRDELLKTAIGNMRDNYDVVTVCAGGNGKGPTMTSPVYPGDFEECVSVTALDNKGNNAAWSDYNEFKDISAPGADIVSTWNDAEALYAESSGTSMATPMVSGIMAMMWASNPELTVDQAISVVKDSAYPVNTQVNDRGDKTGSAGAIDAAAAVKYAKTPDDVEKKPRPAAIGSIKLSKTSYEYDGKAKKPAVTVTASVDGQLVNVAEAITADTSDIDLTYQSGRVKVGTYTVKAKGIGKYKDTLQATFKINPRKTTIKSVKGNRKAITVKWSKKTTQVTGYQVKYSTSKSFSGSSTHTKTITKNSTTSKKITKLKAKKKYYVKVRTYKTVSGKKYYSSWSAVKSVKTR